MMLKANNYTVRKQICYNISWTTRNLTPSLEEFNNKILA
jgi:hypothetical protein